MKGKRVSVLYRENCGGILRNLASGLYKTINGIADIDLYEDLRERIFKEDVSIDAEPKQQKMSA